MTPRRELVRPLNGPFALKTGKLADLEFIQH